jgi:flagellar protein FlgJ
MTPEEFVKTYLPQALKVQSETGFDFSIPMTQAALESGWGSRAVGFNFFGIKSNSKTPKEKRQLITTTEYLKSPNVKFPEVLSVVRQPNGLFKYKVKDWFMKYDSASEAFADHIGFFLRNKRYSESLKWKCNPERFFEEIAKAGYATAPDYANKLKSVRKSVLRRIPK